MIAPKSNDARIMGVKSLRLFMEKNSRISLPDAKPAPIISPVKTKIILEFFIRVLSINCASLREKYYI